MNKKVKITNYTNVKSFYLIGFLLYLLFTIILFLFFSMRMISDEHMLMFSIISGILLFTYMIFIYLTTYKYISQEEFLKSSCNYSIQDIRKILEKSEFSQDEIESFIEKCSNDEENENIEDTEEENDSEDIDDNIEDTEEDENLEDIDDDVKNTEENEEDNSDSLNIIGRLILGSIIGIIVGVIFACLTESFSTFILIFIISLVITFIVSLTFSGASSSKSTCVTLNDQLNYLKEQGISTDESYIINGIGIIIDRKMTKVVVIYGAEKPIIIPWCFISDCQLIEEYDCDIMDNAYYHPENNVRAITKTYYKIGFELTINDIKGSTTIPVLYVHRRQVFADKEKELAEEVVKKIKGILSSDYEDIEVIKLTALLKMTRYEILSPKDISALTTPNIVEKKESLEYYNETIEEIESIPKNSKIYKEAKNISNEISSIMAKSKIYISDNIDLYRLKLKLISLYERSNDKHLEKISIIEEYIIHNKFLNNEMLTDKEIEFYSTPNDEFEIDDDTRNEYNKLIKGFDKILKDASEPILKCCEKDFDDCKKIMYKIKEILSSKTIYRKDNAILNNLKCEYIKCLSRTKDSVTEITKIIDKIDKGQVLTADEIEKFKKNYNPISNMTKEGIQQIKNATIDAFNDTELRDNKEVLKLYEICEKLMNENEIKLRDELYLKKQTETCTNLLYDFCEKEDNKKTNYIVQIKELKELLDMGAITEEEFNKKKKELLK